MRRNKRSRRRLFSGAADSPSPAQHSTAHEYDKFDILLHAAGTATLLVLACKCLLAKYDIINTDHLEYILTGVGEDSSMPAGSGW